MKNRTLKILLLLLALIIVAAMATFMTSCGKEETAEPATTEAAPVNTAAPADTGAVDVPTGDKEITVDVVDDKGGVTPFTLNTSAENLEDALVEANLVEGTESEYGLYITTVNGITADYDADGSWWAIQKDGEMLMTGARDTVIADGDHYELVYTK